MSHNQTSLLVALAGFAGGFLAGMVLAPEPGLRVRRQIGLQLQAQCSALERAMRSMEAQLDALERQLHASGDQFAARMRTLADKATEQYLPNPDLTEEEWDLQRKELHRDLPGLPR